MKYNYIFKNPQIKAKMHCINHIPHTCFYHKIMMIILKREQSIK